MKVTVGYFLVAGLLGGCHSTPAAAEVKPTTAVANKAETKPAEPQDPAHLAFEEFRSSSYQASAATDALDEALDKLKAITPKFKGAGAQTGLKDAADLLNSAGTAFGDFADDEAKFEDFQKDELANWTKSKSDRIIVIQDALHELRDAEETLDDLSDSAPASLINPIEDVGGKIDEAIESAKDALDALGAKEVATTDAQAN